MTDADFQFQLSGKKRQKTFQEAVVFAIEIESCLEARSSIYWEIWKSCTIRGKCMKKRDSNLVHDVIELLQKK